MSESWITQVSDVFFKIEGRDAEANRTNAKKVSPRPQGLLGDTFLIYVKFRSIGRLSENHFSSSGSLPAIVSARRSAAIML